MKQCPKCHRENEPDANFCIGCKYHFAAAAAPQRLCPAGKHTMDPAWTSCPYCKAAQGSAAADNPQKLTVGDDELSSQLEPKRQTVFGLAEAAAANVAGAGSPAAYLQGRRIVALLVTYSWRQEGQVFPVYEGRNYLGHDTACEICLPQDTQLSSQHAAIFYRGARFEISDEKSLNGTYVNGTPVPLAGQLLPNYAELKTGATVWRFVAVEPSE